MTMVTVNDGGGSGGSGGSGSSLRCNGGGSGGGGGACCSGHRGGGGGGGGGDVNCKDEVNDSGGMDDWQAGGGRRAVGCGQRAAGCWGDDDGDNEVNDRSCDEVHCCSGVKFFQFLMH
jgi:hypothetical protein